MIAHIINTVFAVSIGFLMGIWWAGAHMKFMEGGEGNGK